MSLAYPIGSFKNFISKVRSRLLQLSDEMEIESFVMPVGIFLVIDEEHGGDLMATELIRRLNLLDRESKNIIDFYYLGWKRMDSGIQFDLDLFEESRNELKKLGVKKFGGNADLILVDAEKSSQGCILNFKRAIWLNLSKSISQGEISDLGDFLQTIIYVAEEIRISANKNNEGSVVFKISDSLGLAIAKQSILDFILQKWGKIIGAKKLKAIAVRSIGPKVPILNKIHVTDV